MTQQVKDRVWETTTSTGTGSIVLAGAVNSLYQTVSGSGFANGDTGYFFIGDQAGGSNWEITYCTYVSASNSLTRNTVLASTNAGALVNLPAGTKDVFQCVPAAQIARMLSVDLFTAAGDLLYASGAGAVARLPASANGMVLSLSGGLPAWLSASPNVTLFGAGDGTGGNQNLSISSGTTTLTRDTSYNNVTISGTAKINLNGFVLRVCGTLDISAAGAGALFNIAVNGNNASGSTGGAATNGALYFNSIGTTLPYGAASGAGGNGSTTITNVAGSVGANVYGILYFAGGGSAGNASGYGPAAAGGASSGGAGGAGSSGAGKAGAANGIHFYNMGGFVSPIPVPNPTWLAYCAGPTGPSTPATSPAFVGGTSPGAGGGGGGAGDGTNAGGGGGAGGPAMGMLAIYANIIALGSNTTVGIINMVGGRGGNGAASAGGNAGGGGGGGGGCGGCVWIVAGSITRSGSGGTSAIDVSGGQGGNGGNGAGSGVGGTGGVGGYAGNVFLWNLSAGASVYTSNLTATAGTAATTASTTTGTTGGAGGVKQVNL